MAGVMCERLVAEPSQRHGPIKHPSNMTRYYKQLVLIGYFGILGTSMQKPFIIIVFFGFFCFLEVLSALPPHPPEKPNKQKKLIILKGFRIQAPKIPKIQIIFNVFAGASKT